MSHTPRIRAATKGDIEPYLDLVEKLNDQGSLADPRYEMDPDWRKRMRAWMLHEWFGTFQPFPCAWVAEVEGQIVGLVQGDVVRPHPMLVRPPTVRIGQMWVEEPFRRKGLATRLVKTYVAKARQAGFPWVEVGTLGKDARAVAFWKAQGFDDWRVQFLSTPD